MVQTETNIKQQSAEIICPTAQVRAMTSKLRQPVNSDCGSLGPHSFSSHSSISVPVDQKSEGPGNSETGRKKIGNLSQIGIYICFILTCVCTPKGYFQFSFVYSLQNNRDDWNVVYI